MTDPIRLASAAQYTERPPLPHQLAAWNRLQERQSPEVMQEFAELFRAGPTPVKAPLAQDASLLSVPYFSQNDNRSGTGYRECFSSSCAMLAAYHGVIKSDDAYNVVRAKFGDSTDAGAQVKALWSLGLNAKFSTNGTAADLENEINHRRPVAVGWLHHGSVAAPSGGGHWSCVMGYSKTAIIHHDPNGECDLVAGLYINKTGGRSVSYSRRNWLPRWSPSPSSGWFLTARPA
jgi:hypothetical protein